jgi:hypothetical protein
MGKLMIRNADDTAWITIAGVGTVIQQDAEPATPHAGMMWLDTDATSGLQSELRDADGDTKIQCEESADEDIIRMDCAGTEVWNMSAAGERTMALQPAFLTQLSTDQLNFATGTSVTVLFDTEIFDQGSDFNTGTYTFTAPVTGRYRLSYHLRLNSVDSAADYYYGTILTSNRTHYATIFDPGVWTADMTYFHIAYAVLADMDANDTALIKVWQQAGTAQTDIDAGGWSEFSGELVC